MQKQGTDGVSRGNFNEGVTSGQNMLSFCPWHLSPSQRNDKLKTWITSWLGSETEFLQPKDWFLRGHDLMGGTKGPHDALARDASCNEALMRRRGVKREVRREPLMLVMTKIKMKMTMTMTMTMIMTMTQSERERVKNAVARKKTKTRRSFTDKSYTFYSILTSQSQCSPGISLPSGPHCLSLPNLLPP